MPEGLFAIPKGGLASRATPIRDTEARGFSCFRGAIAFTLLVGTCASGLFASTPEATRIGIYHWAGHYPHSMSEGVETIAGLGGHTARVALSARYYRDYNIAPDCHPNVSLASAVQEADVRRSFDNPEIEVFIITAYDGVTFGDRQTMQFLDPAFYTPAHSAAVIQEYSDFTLYLYRACQHTHKRFIISNWEGDNAVYCNQAYLYATDAAFRASCRSQYPSFGIASPEDALQGLRLWLQLRAQGISEGRYRAEAEGIGGRRVYSAPEFNIVRALHDQRLPSVLYDILPFIAFDYVSYSAWESINTADPTSTLIADLDTIRDVVGSSAIIIGEAGCARQSNSGAEVARVSEVISTALRWGVAYVIHWQLYDADAVNAFGLYDLDGQSTLLANWFRVRFQQGATAQPCSGRFLYRNRYPSPLQ